MSELIDSLGESWIWLGGSLLAGIVCANVAWFFRLPRPGPVGRFIGLLKAWPFSGWLLQAMRLLFYAGIPFAALVLGHDAVTSRFLGLQSLAMPTPGESGAGAVIANWRDWTGDIGRSAALGIVLWLVLAFAWWRYRRALQEIGETTSCAVGATSAWPVFREAVYHEAHWAFYRNAPIMVLGAYWGTWIGLVLVGLEASLNPGWRHAFGDTQHSPHNLMRVSLALASSVLFLQTQNLWLAMAVHFGVSLGLEALSRRSDVPDSEHGQVLT
jgi:hypothetical protein